MLLKEWEAAMPENISMNHETNVVRFPYHILLNALRKDALPQLNS
jgi:hypothetical protein